jgi:glycerate kinase
VLIPRNPLVACGPFGSLSAPRAAAAIGRGLRAGGLPEPDILLLTGVQDQAADVRELLACADFDTRMRRARAVIVGAWRLREQTLAGSAAFEIATRARQTGVPAYAVTGENRLDLLDARILDLQTILEAEGTRALAAAGRKLAQLL